MEHKNEEEMRLKKINTQWIYRLNVQRSRQQRKTRHFFKSEGMLYPNKTIIKKTWFGRRTSTTMYCRMGVRSFFSPTSQSLLVYPLSWVTCFERVKKRWTSFITYRRLAVCQYKHASNFFFFFFSFLRWFRLQNLN